ncbi:MAG: ADP-ribosylglycohydrolase family protein [Planctomycetota bacterium]|nr:ADP-ribosylglycohydrolase family protein [Planctomycetota bacterium]
MNLESHITGCILGTAIGDALGLAYECVSRRRLTRLLGPATRYRFLFGRGMVSDDTEHTCLVAQSLIAGGDDVEEFSRQFARRLRWWFLRLPAGVGWATARASIKLWFGARSRTSGVFSAGNGPAMRAAIFGAVFDHVDEMLPFVRASTRITHTDPKAEYGAIAVALAAHLAKTEPSINPTDFVGRVDEIIGAEGREFTELLHRVAASIQAGRTTSEFAVGLGLEAGVSGYTYHTVPVAIHAWLAHRVDYRSAVMEVIECGGDADTTAAIVGGIIGAGAGESVIPAEWVAMLIAWPMSTNWMRKLATQLAESIANTEYRRPVGLNPLLVLLRNSVFLVVVLLHGFRRLLPPY